MVAHSHQGTEQATLEYHRQSGAPLAVRLLSGVLLRGELVAYDQHALLLRRGEEVSLVRKARIATVMASADARRTASDIALR
jgi:RNA chaperone Hfq